MLDSQAVSCLFAYMLDLHCRIIWHQDPADNSHTSNFKAPGKPRNNQFWKEEKSMGGLVIK